MNQKPGTSDLPQEVTLTIPILQNMEVAATQTAEAVARFMEFDSDEIDELKHALIEACINAFEHSKSVENKVYIKFVMRPEDLTVVIQDYGHGFDKESVPRPDLTAKVLGKDDYKRGWGLMLIESLMDTVEIVSGETGTMITMTKLRQKGGSQ
ncbi:MAG TPA: ATP-binding protein [Stenomitos sp.]